MPDGSVVLVEVRGACLSRVDARGRCEKIADLGGGPNGAALGPEGAVYVCNNGGMPFTRAEDGSWSPVDDSGASQGHNYSGGRIQRVSLDTGRVDVLYESADGRVLRAPNDLVFTPDGSFWFTDTGKTRARDRDHGGLYRASADGSRIETWAYPLLGPNGVGLSPDGLKLYVAETPTGRLREWDVSPDPGKQMQSRNGRVLMRLPGEMVFDSIAVDSAGAIIAALPGSSALAVISPEGDLGLIEMPDRMPTNVAFGGAERRTAFVTLGWTGRLASFQWPRPGAELAF
jgi:gluconolactonase